MTWLGGASATTQPPSPGAYKLSTGSFKIGVADPGVNPPVALSQSNIEVPSPLAGTLILPHVSVTCGLW